MSGKTTISDRFDSGADRHAKVTNNRLWVDAVIGSQPIATKPNKSAIVELLNDTFDNLTTSANSSTFDSSDYRDLLVYLEMSISGGNPTSLRFFAQFSTDGGTTWTNYAVDQWVDLRYIAGQLPLNESIPLNYPIGSLFRVRVVATGTTAVNTFDVVVSVQGIS